MGTRKLYLFLISLLLLNTQINGSWLSFLDYIWPNRNAQLFNGDVQALPKVPFEIGDRDERFILEASKVLGTKLTDLDFCQQKIILMLQKSCSALNEEQVGKLSVLLMNCQLLLEGRKSYECTDSMSLAECTSSMAVDTRQLYYNYENRAKTICLIIRQDQFRGLAEITANKLIKSAHDNINLMADLKGHQNELQQVATASREEIATNNLKLLEQQHDLLKIAENQRINADHNLQITLREKDLLKTGHLEMGALIVDLKAKIQSSLANFQDQSEEAREIYGALLHDISELHRATEKITLQLDEASRFILEQSQLTKDEFKETVAQLREVNSIVLNLSDVISDFREDYKEKLEWLRQQLGGSEDVILKRISAIFIHIVYLLVGMLCLVFINVTMLSRILFLLVVFLNLVAVLYDFVQLDLSTLTQSILIVFASKYLYQLLQKYDLKKYFEMAHENNRHVKEKSALSNNHTTRRSNYASTRATRSETLLASTTPISNSIDRNNNDETIVLDSSVDSVRNGISFVGRRTMTNLVEANINEGDVSDRSRRYSSTPFSTHSSSQILNGSGVNRCKAVTMRGTQCQMYATKRTSSYCRIHERPSCER